MVEEPAERAGHQPPGDPHLPEVRTARRAGDLRHRADQPARPPRLLRAKRPLGARRPRDQHPHHSRGVMTGVQPRKAGVGGEVLCNVWKAGCAELIQGSSHVTYW